MSTFIMVKTLLKSVREYRRDALRSPAFVTGEVILECLLPLLMARVIDSMSGESMTPILLNGGLLLILASFSLLFGIFAARAAATASCGFARNLRRDQFVKVQEFAFADIDHFSTSSLVTRMTTDVTNVQNAFGMIIRGAIRSPLMLIFSVTMSITIHPKMTLIFLIMIPILGLALFAIIFKVFPIFRRIFKRYDAMNNSIQENVAGIRVVKSFVREEYEEKKFLETSDAVKRDFVHVERILALNNPIMLMCINTAMLLVSYFGATIIIDTAGSELSTGQLSSLISYGIQILSSLMMLSMVFVMITIAGEAANRIAEVLTYESTLVTPENGITQVEDGSIRFENVSFTYENSGGKPSLSDISLDIASGSTVGILGGTGSSKTTLIQLISRLYDATEGRVMVGGRDVRDYELTALRSQVAVVLQKNVLFSGTIRENLCWGKEDATEEELRHVCSLAQAAEFIDRLPEGYDTRLERGGTNVSGGQKQRLCIARAILKKPKILILDDSTSAVDTRTDALIRKALKEEIPDTTKLIIAQRVASIEDADCILVMEEGRIAEQGTHEELLAIGGIYKEIYETQTKRKEAV